MRTALALLALLLPSTAAAMRDLPAPPRALEKCASGDFSATPRVEHPNALQVPKGTEEDRPACTAIASGSVLFLQRDPNGYEDSVNLYAGMRWDPINLRDPTGRETLYGRTLTKTFSRRESARRFMRETTPNRAVRCADHSHTVTGFVCGFGSTVVNAAFGAVASIPTVLGAIIGVPSSVERMNQITDPATGPLPRAIGETVLINDRVISNPDLLYQAVASMEDGEIGAVMGESSGETFLLMAPAASGRGPSPRVFEIRKGLSIEQQAALAAEQVGGLSAEQAQFILNEGFKRKSSVVFGGSRVRGDFNAGSNLDLGFGSLTETQASTVLRRIRRHARDTGGIAPEPFPNVPGKSSATVPEIAFPEEFFQRSGVRRAGRKAGSTYEPSGSITFEADGTVTIISPGVPLAY